MVFIMVFLIEIVITIINMKSPIFNSFLFFIKLTANYFCLISFTSDISFVLNMFHSVVHQVHHCSKKFIKLSIDCILL